jgi:serine/threonine protein kinase
MDTFKDYYREEEAILPDFSDYGYRAIGILGRNRAGGRVTYRAEMIENGIPVVIKKFAFYSSDWEGLKEIEREASILRGLEHPGIPKYLDSFQYEGTVCLVQEYIAAETLRTDRTYRSGEIEEIALKCLEILEYLQSRTPPIVHRDLKPENILYDASSGKIFAIDFGFSRPHGGSVSLSSAALGTFGFMPPEAIFNRLNLSSDLYSLGVTLICLARGIGSDRLADFLRDDLAIDARKLLSDTTLTGDFKKWVAMLVARELSSRPANARAARRALLKTREKTAEILPRREFELRSRRSRQRIKRASVAGSVTAIGVTIAGGALYPLYAAYSPPGAPLSFAVVKTLQRNYPDFRGRVDTKDCYSGLAAALRQSRSEKMEKDLKRSLDCLKITGYPIDRPALETDARRLFRLKNFGGAVASDIDIVAPGISPSGTRRRAAIERLEGGLSGRAMAIEKNFSLLGSSGEELEGNIFQYASGVATPLSMIVGTIAGIFTGIVIGLDR